MRLTVSLFTNAALGVLGTFCLLGLQGSSAQIKTVEFLFNLDLLQCMPELYRLHHSYSGCMCAELSESTGSTQILSPFGLHHTIKMEIA